ncbi:hypothetical protein, partial [Flavobacterium sp.]|uniref:hypothetical protein n=1 Tax=Flavobacterium sp. TaxID=239 RepID=UPI0025B9CE78
AGIVKRPTRPKNRLTNKRKSLKKEQHRKFDFKTTNGCQKTTICSEFTTVSSGHFYRTVFRQNNFVASFKNIKI